MQTVKGVKVRCIKLLKNKVYKFARYSLLKHYLMIVKSFINFLIIPYYIREKSEVH